MMFLVVGFGPYLQMHLLIMVLIVMLQRVQISSKYYLVYVLLFWHLKAPKSIYVHLIIASVPIVIK